MKSQWKHVFVSSIAQHSLENVVFMYLHLYIDWIFSVQ
jgi:hypothetical protein